MAETDRRFITIVCEVPQGYARVERVMIERLEDGELDVPEHAKICGVLQDDMLDRIRSRLFEWCDNAGWYFGDHSIRTPLMLLIGLMESAHCTERSYADLASRGGIHPEFYAQANERFRAAAHRIAGELEQAAVELRRITTPSREA